MPDRRHQCPVCGSQVCVVSTDEGTSHYQPVARKEAVGDEATEIRLSVTLEAAQDALKETMGELRQVCEILGGLEFTESAIDLAMKTKKHTARLESSIRGHELEENRLREIRDRYHRESMLAQAALATEAERSKQLAQELDQEREAVVQLSHELEEWQADRNVIRVEADALEAEVEQLRTEVKRYRQLYDGCKQAAYDAVLRAEQAEAECERLRAEVEQLKSLPAVVVGRQNRPPLVIEGDDGANP